MELLKSIGTGIRSILGPKGPRAARDPGYRNIPDTFPEGTLFYSFGEWMYAFIPDDGWFRIGLNDLRFIQSTQPTWPEIQAQPIDELTVRARLQAWAMMNTRKRSVDELSEQYQAARREALSKVDRFPPIPDTFPVGTEFWEYESNAYVYVPEEGWFRADQFGLTFYLDSDADLPAHLWKYGIPVFNAEFQLLLKGELREIIGSRPPSKFR